MFSIVCVFNNQRTLDEYLIQSLNRQSALYELILVDNTRNNYHSAANALNHGANLTKNQYLMFIHQDIRFESDSSLTDMERYLVGLGHFGVVGVAGKKDWQGTMTNLLHGIPPQPAGEIRLSGPTEVQTVDECLFITPKDLFETNQFDERTCTDWHLYGVDYCLSMKKMGHPNFIIPVCLYHRSAADSMSIRYYRTLKKLIIKHRNNYRVIYTTMGNWITFLPILPQKYGFWQNFMSKFEKIIGFDG